MTTQPVIISAPWSLTKLADTLDKTPKSIRTAICRGKFPIPAKRILGRIYFTAEDVAWLLSGDQGVGNDEGLPPPEDRTELENLALDYLTRQGACITSDVYAAIGTLFSPAPQNAGDVYALEAKTVFAVEMTDAAIAMGQDAEGQRLRVAPHIVEGFSVAAEQLTTLVRGEK